MEESNMKFRCVDEFEQLSFDDSPIVFSDEYG